MNDSKLNIVFLGLSITSSWGNGHATTYRGLVRELNRLGHSTLFLERDAPWYADHRDPPDPSWGRVRLYSSVEELKDTAAAEARSADLVVVGSFTPDGAEIAEWIMSLAPGVVAFYDIDTPVTLGALRRGVCDYLSYPLVRRFDLYLSFTGGPTLSRIERELGSPMARPLYCSFDPDAYGPDPGSRGGGPLIDLGYMGTHSEDRQGPLERLLIKPAEAWRGGRFIVAGPLYPETLEWPENVERVEHLPPDEHRAFYNSQRFTLNLTRAEMIEAGYSPSVRLFEAAACGTPIISDWWLGLDCFFKPDEDILISRSCMDTLRILRETPEEERLRLGHNARRRALERHTAAHRALDLDRFAREALGRVRRRALA